MRVIKSHLITNGIANLFIKANTIIRDDVFYLLKASLEKEKNLRAKDILYNIIGNAKIAKNESLPICQDTGLPVVFVELGSQTKIEGNLKKAINRGVELGYRKGNLRKSIIIDPLCRTKSVYSPAVIYIDIIEGDKIKITVLPKGFGAENKSQLKMFRPTATLNEIENFILETVKNAGPDACPPYVVGIGIGGTAEYSLYLAKKALLRDILKPSKMEKKLLKMINKLNIGPMGLGGSTTALGVSIETAPTHIAGLPIAVNISCHALRSAMEII